MLKIFENKLNIIKVLEEEVFEDSKETVLTIWLKLSETQQKNIVNFLAVGKKINAIRELDRWGNYFDDMRLALCFINIIKLNPPFYLEQGVIDRNNKKYGAMQEEVIK